MESILYVSRRGYVNRRAGRASARRGAPRLGVVSISDLIDRPGTTADEEDIDEAERAKAVEQILTIFTAATPPGWDQAEWNGLVASLTRQIVTVRDEVAQVPRRAAGSGPRSDEFDEMSLAETASSWICTAQQWPCGRGRSRNISDSGRAG